MVFHTAAESPAAMLGVRVLCVQEVREPSAGLEFLPLTWQNGQAKPWVRS